MTPEEYNLLSSISLCETESNSNVRVLQQKNLKLRATDASHIPIIEQQHESDQKNLIIMMGYPGVGKTTTAHRISKAMPNTAVVSRDRYRAIHDRTSYFDRDEGSVIDQRFFSTVVDMLDTYSNVILDATFRLFVKREEALLIAHNHGCQFFIIECICSESTLLRRLNRQQISGEKKTTNFATRNSGVL